MSAARDRVAEATRAGRFDPFAALGLSAATRHELDDVNRAFRKAVRQYHPDSSATPDEPRFQAAVDAHDLLKRGQADVDAWREVVRAIAVARAEADDASAARDRVAEATRAGLFDPFAALGLSAARRQPVAEVARAFRMAVRRYDCLLYTSPSPRDGLLSRMPSSA